MEEYVYITKYEDVITGAYRTKEDAIMHTIEDAMCYNPKGLSFEDFKKEYEKENILRGSRGSWYYEKIPLM